MTRKPREKASITLARTQPEVMQPVTITVSTPSRVRMEPAGVAKKIEGADFISTTSGPAAAIRGSNSTAGVPASRSKTGSAFQCGAARRL